MKSTDHKDLAKSIWLFIPIFIVSIVYFARLISPKTDSFIYGELGLIENSTFIFLLITIFFAAWVLIFLNLSSKFKLLKTWIFLFLLGAVYYAGEEISWGQHFFDWQASETWKVINDQNETNLHNSSALFDQVPRALLSLLTLIGGVIIPIYRKITGYIAKNCLKDWIIPTLVCSPSAILALLVGIPNKVGITLLVEIKAGEVKECLLALFMMIYILSIWYRAKTDLSE